MATSLKDTFGRKYFRARRTSQLLFASFWLSLPLSGLLQVDVARVRLVIAGHPWPAISADMLPAEALARGAAPRWDLIAPVLLSAVLPVIAFVIAFVLVARYFGRVHCGFSCTYGFLAETGEALFRWAKKPGPGRAGRLAAAWAVVIAAAPFVAFTILSLFVTTGGVARGLAAMDMAIVVPFAFFTVLATLVGGFVRLKFCRYVCGVGFVQTLAWMSNPKALEMGFNPKASEDGTKGSLRDCTGCHGCRDVCPIGFDPRTPKKSMMACFQCGECLKACEDELYPKGKGVAISFHFDEPDYPLQKPGKAPSIVRMAKDLQTKTADKA